MSPRAIGGLLFLLAALLYFGVAIPTRARAGAAQEEFSRARVERQRLRLQRAELERRQAAVERAAQVLATEVRPDGDAVNRLRVFVVETLKGRAVFDVRLSVGGGRPPVAATVRVSAGGSFAELMGLCRQLARPGTGIVLERVRLSGNGSGLALDLEGLRLGGPP